MFDIYACKITEITYDCQNSNFSVDQLINDKNKRHDSYAVVLMKYGAFYSEILPLAEVPVCLWQASKVDTWKDLFNIEFLVAAVHNVEMINVMSNSLKCKKTVEICVFIPNVKGFLSFV